MTIGNGNSLSAPGALEHDVDDEEQPHGPLNVAHKLQFSLVDLERAGGLTGWVAAALLSAGGWIDKELEERRQTIGGIDNLWFLVTDAADFNPVCASTYTFRGKLTLEDVRHAAITRGERFPRYKQRVTSVGRSFHGARFEDDPNFDINNHIRSVTLPEPAGKHELNKLMGKFIAQDWDLSRPLWELLLVENYHDEDGAESAMITRGHHSLADGQGFIISQLYITSYRDTLVKVMDSAAKKLRNARRGRILPSRLHRSLRPLDSLAQNPSTAPLLEVFLACIFWLVYLVSICVALLWSVYHGIHQAALFLLTCWRVDHLTGPQPGPRVKEREFASSRAFSMHDVKLCQSAFSGPYPGFAAKGVPKEKRHKARSKAGHVTLNDVVCAVVADVLEAEIVAKPEDQMHGQWGRVKRWLRGVLRSPIGVFIPISVRSPGDWSMRNLSTGSLVFLNPSSNLTPDISERQIHAHIHQCRAELSLLKHSLWPKIEFNVLQLTGQAPVLFRISLLANPARHVKEWITEHVTRPFYEWALQTFAVVLTNVPGPAKHTINMEGIEVINWTALPPQGGKGTIGMGIISYAGGLSIAVAADMVPSSQGTAERICARFEERFELYAQRAREVLNHLD
ncbi:uncharacterized protein LAESUDRAFT_765129 [Laetiporus sulphureus 93-53]|uniref:Uncharacterized protein n=1 Tax=Laetiporus sulphureus 93-53 TaxID=1314785 RepID=A0A165AY96_9APHY|nr:uncharacterized protein LAESUDRAFT_765129 [Laetiporus sulphureus 93-53]KZS99885.1 hypothetical protein LAESUDRAFT_765129 [Laetiporus sulphureus 93-53]